jgi:hypothetical protein
VSFLDVLGSRIRSAVPAGSVQDEDTRGLFRMYAVLLLAKGDATTAADVHNAWCAWMADRQPRHESLVPFEELSVEQRTQDAAFVSAIRVTATSSRLPDAPIDDALFDAELFPKGTPVTEEERGRMFELYKLMVASSEGLVARRQGVNTFFLTINGAILTAAGLVLGSGAHNRFEAAGLVVLSCAGAILALAWKSLIVSFGQLNRGKFKVINRMELEFPAAIYLAEWNALGSGNDRKRYQTFTSREIWTPWAFFAVHAFAAAVELVIAIGVWTPG